MNARKPIYTMMVLGAVAILALTFAPYALMKDARRAAAAYIKIPLGQTVPASAVPAPAQPSTPAFDVAGWYTGRGGDPGDDEVRRQARQRLRCHETLENVHSMWMKKEE